MTAIPDTMTRSASCSAVQHLDVLGITTIGGNCTLENVTRNAIKVLEVLGVADRIGVYPGHSCPMVAPLVTAPQFHGETGLDGPVLPEPTHAAQNKHAVDFIVDTVMSTDDVTLIATGPLTNIASAINREPRIVERVKELCIMAGPSPTATGPLPPNSTSSSTPRRHRACSTPVCTSR